MYSEIVFFLQISLLAGIAYFFWHKIFMMYYRYFYYRRQGVPGIGFPLPFFGNLFGLLKHAKNQSNLKRSAFEE